MAFVAKSSAQNTRSRYRTMRTHARCLRPSRRRCGRSARGARSRPMTASPDASAEPGLCCRRGDDRRSGGGRWRGDPLWASCAVLALVGMPTWSVCHLTRSCSCSAPRHDRLALTLRCSTNRTCRPFAADVRNPLWKAGLPRPRTALPVAHDPVAGRRGSREGPRVDRIEGTERARPATQPPSVADNPVTSSAGCAAATWRP